MENEPKLDIAKMVVDNKRKTIAIAVAAVLVVAAGFSFWYWSKNQQAQEAPTLGSEIFDKTQNQLEGQIPDTNPFKNQKNPFDVIYKNPFE